MRLKACLLLALVGCGDNLDLYDGFTPAEWEQLSELSPLPDPPADNTNKYADNAAAAVLGQKLFYDKRLSGPITLAESTPEQGQLGAVGEEHKYSCVSCHDPNQGYVDTRSNPANTSLGTGGWFPRNALALSNAVYYKWSGWQGFIDTFWGHSLMGIEVATAANGDRLRTAHLLWDKYRDEYNAIFEPDLDPALDANAVDAARFPPFGRPKSGMNPDGPYEMMTPEDQKHATLALVNASKALAAYQRKLIRRNAPFDKFMAGDETAISESAKRGAGLFVGKAACVECHSGPFFSDQKFHNLGVPQEGERVAVMDMGRTTGITLIKGGIKQWTSAGPWSDSPPGDSKINDLVAVPTDLGAFRTQGLRNVADTAPYMHTGAFKTLRDVVVFYNEGGKTEGFMGTKDPLMIELGLTDREIDDLVAFLESLTGEKVPAEIAADITPQ